MAKSLGVFTNWQRIQDYAEKDLEYKEQAREIICKSLGFEPPIHISMLSELTLRQNLRNISNGKITKDTLDKSIEFQLDFIKTIIPKYAPELNHLID